MADDKPAEKPATEQKPVVDEKPVEKPAETPAAEATTEKPAEPEKPAAQPDAKPAEPGKPDAKAEVPEKYALTLPEQTDFDAADLELFGAEAKALGLTNDQAQALVNTRAATVQALKVQYGEDAEKDPEIGGAKFEETVRLARVGRDWLFPPNSEGATLVTALLDKTGLGNHKEVLRAFARVGKQKKEDTAVQPGQQPAKPQQKSLEERLVGA